jgi:hypothetical protein
VSYVVPVLQLGRFAGSSSTELQRWTRGFWFDGRLILAWHDVAMRTVGNVPATVVADQADANRLASLEDVLARCRARGGAVIDVVVQDEFTHDVIVRSDGVFLVFDTT